MKDKVSSLKAELPHNNLTRGDHILHEKQYKYRAWHYPQTLPKYAEKYDISLASQKYNKSRSYIYFWKVRWDGTVESLACQSRRSHNHPNHHTKTKL